MKLYDIEERVRSWMLAHADGPKALWLLFVISFFEASLLPLPPSAFMLGMIALGTRRRWVYLATLTTLTSVAGGLFGYLIGAALYDTVGVWIVEHYRLADEVARLGIFYRDWDFTANFIGAFTPLPYKAFAIASGFFSVNIATFTLASLLGRGLNFFIVAFVAKVFGEHIARSVFRYVAFMTLLAAGIVLAVVLSSR